MGRVLICTGLAAAFAFLMRAQTGAITVFMDFDEKPSAPSIAAMEKEAGEIMKASGLALDWRLVRDNHGSEGVSNLIVLRFKGKCRAYPPLPSAFDEARAQEQPAQPVVLGSTMISNGQVLPFSEVECDSIRKLIANAGTPQHDSLLGRALGRVVAHELFHALAKTAGHARRGLAKSLQTCEELTSKTFRFEESSTELLRQSMREK
jgi:hypothetical protein